MTQLERPAEITVIILYTLTWWLVLRAAKALLRRRGARGRTIGGNAGHDRPGGREGEGNRRPPIGAPAERRPPRASEQRSQQVGRGARPHTPSARPAARMQSRRPRPATRPARQARADVLHHARGHQRVIVDGK